jgi:hypothetical protein
LTCLIRTLPPATMLRTRYKRIASACTSGRAVGKEPLLALFLLQLGLV